MINTFFYCTMNTAVLSVVALMLSLSPCSSYPQFKIPELPTFPPPSDIQNSHYAISPSTSSQNIEDTVKEVEEMLKRNPNLPRLTRGEILDILENITKTDALVNDKVSVNSKQHVRDSKAVMLVKPFTPGSDQIRNIEELFTKPPVTQVIGLKTPVKTIEDNTINTNEDPSQSKRPTKSRTQYRKIAQRTSNSTLATTPTTIKSSSSTTASNSIQRIQKRRRRPSSTTPRTTPSTTITSSSTSSPDKTYITRTRRPVRRRTTTIKYYNHRYPDDPVPVATIPPLPSDGLKLITPPKFNPSQINQDLLSTEVYKKDAVVTYDDSLKTKYPSTENEPFYVQSSTGFPDDVDIPMDLKKIAPEINLESLIKATSPRSKLEPKPFSSNKKEQNKLEDLLAAFGRIPSSKTTTTTNIPDVRNVADTLNPDMRELLMNFGLIPNPEEKKVRPTSESLTLDNYNMEIPEPNPEAYAGFKPLPDDDSSREDMRELLARFGLGRKLRVPKAYPRKEEIKPEESQKIEVINFDMVPEQFKETIKDIGLVNGKDKLINSAALTKTQEKQHVFSPQETEYASEMEMKKIQSLLDFVKKLEKLNGTVTPEDLQKFDKEQLKEFISTINEYNKLTPLNQQKAPNPLEFDRSVDKNDIKRQETTTIMPESTTVDSTEPTVLLSGEKEGPNIKDLEDSFGGKTDPPTSTAAPIESTTPLRKTGFYSLVDWNSFFDIDDQKGKRVNLRFQPTIGDPKRFFRVSVP